MANMLHNCRIDGMWGRPAFTLDFESDATFLIGPNGAGKTRILELIANSLLFNPEKIALTEFSKIQILGRHKERDTEVILQIKRHPAPRTNRVELEHELIISQEIVSNGHHHFYLDDNYNRVRASHSDPSDLASMIAECFNVSFLQLTRYSQNQRRRDIQNDPIDLKLNSLNNKIQAYYSLLKSKEAKVDRELLDSVLLSMLVNEDDKIFLEDLPAKQSPLDEQELVNVFQTLGIDSSRASEGVQHHNALRKLLSSEEEGSLSSYLYKLSERKISKSLEAHNNANIIRNKIFDKWEVFINAMNELLYEKYCYVGSAGFLRFTHKNGAEIDLMDLSSGEKTVVPYHGRSASVL